MWVDSSCIYIFLLDIIKQFSDLPGDVIQYKRLLYKVGIRLETTVTDDDIIGVARREKDREPQNRLMRFLRECAATHARHCNIGYQKNRLGVCRLTYSQCIDSIVGLD